jgi:hypothetical protein
VSEDGLRVRIAWHDGTAGEDEGVVGIASVRLRPGRVSLDFDRTVAGCATAIPYDGADVTYDDVDERSTDLIDIFQRLLASAPERIHLD